MASRKDQKGRVLRKGESVRPEDGMYAIGAGTVSKRVYTDGSGRIERCDTHRDLSLYLSDIQAMIERKRKLFGN